MIAMLIPVDGSEPSLNAVKHAITLARENPPVSVRLLFVYSAPVREGDVGAAVTPQEMAQAERRHADPALAAAERLLREAGVPFTRDIIAGHVAQSIVGHAERYGCNAILMGTRGVGKLSNMIMGSTAADVIGRATVPVTLVR